MFPLVIKEDIMFEYDSILWSLCRERIRVQSHRSHGPPKLKLIDHLMPPRSRWCRPHISIRTEVSELDCLYQTVRNLRKKNNKEDQGWIAGQDAFFTAISTRINADRILIKSPEIYCNPKDPSDPHSYRLIANYDLIDKMIISLCNKYLLKLLDHRFLPCSYAHRSTINGHPPTQHDAFNGIVKYWKDHTDIWVAECDIAGFYDNLSHQVVMDEYDKIMPENADPRAGKILKAYLDSYSFYDYALTQYPDKEIKTHRDKIEKYYASWDGSRIGVSQGGALSGFISNLVLNQVDQKINPSVAYFRYVDDMIVLGEKDQVQDAITTYRNALETLKLPYHPFHNIKVYGDHIWDYKSKNTYRWGRPPGPQPTNIVPWIGFVGYQLRYDGKVRIRESTLNKELKRQLNATDTFIYKSGSYDELRERLETMAVGHRPEFHFESQDPIDCWTAGFRGVECADLPSYQPILKRQLKMLDRERGRQLARARRNLGAVPVEEKRKRRYSGKPWSYFGQFN